METFLWSLWSWVPMLLLIAVWVFFYRKGFARQATYFRTHNDTSAAQMVELSKIHQSLERIASALEERRT